MNFVNIINLLLRYCPTSRAQIYTHIRQSEPESWLKAPNCTFPLDFRFLFFLLLSCSFTVVVIGPTDFTRGFFLSLHFYDCSAKRTEKSEMFTILWLIEWLLRVVCSRLKHVFFFFFSFFFYSACAHSSTRSTRHCAIITNCIEGALRKFHRLTNRSIQKDGPYRV